MLTLWLMTDPPSNEEPKHYLVGKIREALAEDARVNELDIQVTVAGRKVFVSGNVTTADRRKAISTVLAELLPGYDVHNEVRVNRFVETDHVENLS